MDPQGLPPPTPPGPQGPPGPAWGGPTGAPSGPPVAWSPESIAPQAKTGGRGLAAVAGVLALVGAALSVAGTLVPVTIWGDNSQPPFSILPVLDNTVSNSFNEFTWFALEPIGIAVVVTLLGLSLFAVGSPRRAGGGALLAFGLTTCLAFSAYALSGVFTESFGAPYGPTPGPGSWLGIGSGLLLLLAGTLSLIAGSRRRP